MELTREEVERLAELTAQETLGVPWSQAVAEVESGELDGTAAESIIRSLMWLLKAPAA